MWSSPNVTIRICYIELFPIIDNVGDATTPKALQGSLFTNISQSMGLRWERVPAPAHIWGACDPNGTCYGQVEPLQQGTADLALGPVVFTPETLENLRLIWPSYYSTYDVIAGFRSPFQAPGKYTVFNLYPTSIWLAVFICLIALPVIAKFLSRFGSSVDKVTLAEHWSPFMEIFLLETPSIRYSTSPLRMLFAGWMFAALVISSIGNATLKSVMTVLTPARRLETLEDILQLDVDETTIRITAGNGLLDVLKRADHKPMNKLGKMIVEGNGLTHPLYVASASMLRELETQKSVIIIACNIATSLLYSPPRIKLQGTQGYTYCSRGIFGHFYAGFMAQKRTEPVIEQILDEFERRVRWVLESPFPLLLHYETDSPLIADRFISSEEPQQPPQSPTSLTELSGTFIAIGHLGAAAIIVFFVELFWGSGQESAKLLKSCITRRRPRVHNSKTRN